MVDGERLKGKGVSLGGGNSFRSSLHKIPESLFSLLYCLPFIWHTCMHTCKSTHTPPTHRWKFLVLCLLFSGELYVPYKTTGAHKAGVHMQFCTSLSGCVWVCEFVLTLWVFIFRSAEKLWEKEWASGLSTRPPHRSVTQNVHFTSTESLSMFSCYPC